MDGKTGKKEEYYKFNDGWFRYYINVKTGQTKLNLNPETDIEVEHEIDYDQYCIEY